MTSTELVVLKFTLIPFAENLLDVFFLPQWLTLSEF